MRRLVGQTLLRWLASDDRNSLYGTPWPIQRSRSCILQHKWITPEYQFDRVSDFKHRRLRTSCRTYTSPANTGLGFEKGPSLSFQLQWATYYDAADQAGLARIWGGIHPPVDDFAGRRAGAQCGQGVWALAQKYFDGSVTNT